MLISIFCDIFKCAKLFSSFRKTYKCFVIKLSLISYMQPLQSVGMEAMGGTAIRLASVDIMDISASQNVNVNLLFVTQLRDVYNETKRVCISIALFLYHWCRRILRFVTLKIYGLGQLALFSVSNICSSTFLFSQLKKTFN